MSLQIALRLPLQTDLRPLLALLVQLQVPHRVSEERGEQLLWVPAELVEPVRELHAGQQRGEVSAVAQAPVVAIRRRDRWQALRSAPLTLALLLLCLLVAGLTLMGTYLPVVRWFNLLDFQVDGDYLRFVPLAESLARGEWWRLFSPMLLHFWVPGMGPLHLVMNGLWFWELGRRIEARQGPWMLLALTLGFSLVSSLAQYLLGGAGIVGGLSGVLYGLLGHCWLFNRLAPTPAYRLPPGVLGLMLVWLLLCLSGVFEVLVSVANAAHVGGLLAGCASGLLGGLLARRNQRR